MPITTIKNAKRLLALALSVLMICQTAVAADHKSNYELGLDKASNGKWDIAIRYFKKVAESDPHYQEAQTQIQFAEEKQATASSASKAQTQINHDTDRCRNLFEKERSPDAIECIETVKKMQEEASAEFGGKAFVSPALETLRTEMTPYIKVDELAERVKGIAMDANGMDNAQADLRLLEDVLYSQEFPEDAKTMAAVVLTHTYKGATMAFKTSCEIAREGTDQQAADKICGRHEASLDKYTFIKTFLDKGVKLLGSKQVPSKLYSQYRPIGDKAAALPKPEEMALKNKTTVIPAGSGEVKAEESVPTWVPYAIATAVVVIIATVGWYLKSAPAKKPALERQDSGRERPAIQQPMQQTHSLPQQPAFTNPMVQQPQPITTTVTNAVAPEVKLAETLLSNWKGGKAVRMADDSNLAILQAHVKGKFEITQKGHPSSAYLEVRPLNPTKMTDTEKALFDLINKASRK